MTTCSGFGHELRAVLVEVVIEGLRRCEEHAKRHELQQLARAAVSFALRSLRDLAALAIDVACGFEKGREIQPLISFGALATISSTSSFDIDEM